MTSSRPSIRRRKGRSTVSAATPRRPPTSARSSSSYPSFRRRARSASCASSTRSCPATSGPSSATGSTPPATTTSSSRSPLRPLRGSRYALRQPDRFAAGALPKTSAKTTRSSPPPSPPPAPASPSPTPTSPPSSQMPLPHKGTITTWKRAAFCHFPPFEKSPPPCVFPSNVIKYICFSIGVLYP